MKKFVLSVFLLTTVSMLLLTSCQSEETQISNENPQNLTSTTPLTGLLSRVSQDSTSQDNVIDSTSCFRVNLPVTVVVNNQQITIVDEVGYATVQNILNEFSDDDDEVSFIFPITITFNDYSTAVITNNDDLDDIIDDCGDDNDDDEIECLTVNYPVTISYYNAGSQTPSTVTITSDSQLYNFFEDFDVDDYATINYPISVTDGNGQQIVINNNSELQIAIETADNSCDDNNDVDDDDHDDSNNTDISSNFISLLESGTWRVTYFFDDLDETSNFSGYNFTFNSNGNVSVITNSDTFSGLWDAYVDDNEDTLELSFSALQLEELEDDWEIIEYTQTQIRLKDVSGGNGETDYLTFTKN